ncbi:MAG TPA: PTS ascorbate transporter subunit IIC [Haloplasmataceae bacterium]
MSQLLDFIINLFRTPAIILGIVAMIGLIVQRKSFGDIFSGTVKTALGMLVLAAGSGLIVSEILPFVDLFQSVFGLEGFATGSENIVSAMQGVAVIASSSALIMAIGFLVNVALARFTPLKYVFLTGHMMWIASVSIAYSLYVLGLSETLIVIFGSLLQGVVLTLLPAISQPIVRKVTGSDDFAIAHLTTLGTVSSGYIGGLLGDKSKSAEDIKLPKFLEFFKDTAISVSIVMLFFYLVVVIAAGPTAVGVYAQGQNYIVFGILKAFGFAAGILILLQGVRLMLGELVPSFKGISDKLVPGAKPALDVPALFGFGQNSLMIGFITAVIGMIVAMFVSSLILNVTPLVSIIGAFFTGGVAGIMGNATGGRRGAAIAGFVYGFLLIFLSGVLYKMFDFSAINAAGLGHDCIDVMILMMFLKYWYVGVPIIIAAYVFYSFLEVRYQKRNSL